MDLFISLISNITLGYFKGILQNYTAEQKKEGKQEKIIK
jgi:hypothetical protein